MRNPIKNMSAKSKKHRKHGLGGARGRETERLVESRSLRNPMTCCHDLPQQLSRLPLRLHVSNLTCVTISYSNFVNNMLFNLRRPIKTGAPFPCELFNLLPFSMQTVSLHAEEAEPCRRQTRPRSVGQFSRKYLNVVSLVGHLHL